MEHMCKIIEFAQDGNTVEVGAIVMDNDTNDDVSGGFNAVARERLCELIFEKFPTLEAYADLIYDGPAVKHLSALKTVNGK